MYFDYPIKAKFGRKIPKTKFYENSSLSTKLKNKFVSQIDRIIWQYKLAPETINLNATDTVPEIQIFDVILKTNEIDQELLEVIDKAVNFPIIFQIYKNKRVKIKAAYKRPSESAKNKWVVESYFESGWLDKDISKDPIPQSLNLEKLYEKIVNSLMPSEIVNRGTQKTIEEQVGIINKIELIKKDLDKLNSKYKKERQHNRQFEINKQIKLKQLELNQLLES